MNAHQRKHGEKTRNISLRSYRQGYATLLITAAILLVGSVGWYTFYGEASVDGSIGAGQIDLQHDPGSYTLFIPYLANPPRETSELEVVQAVQEPGNSVSLIADRTTFVRYVVTSETPYTNVNAWLYGSRAGVPLPGSPIAATNNPRTLQPAYDRFWLDASFNFELPTSWASGEISLWGYATDGDTFIQVNGPQTYAFQESESLHVTVVPIDYICTSGGVGTTTPSPPYDYLTDFTYRVYPVPSVTTATHVSIDYYGPCYNGEPNPTYNTTDGGDWGSMLNAITALWWSEGGPSSYYYGLVDIYCGGSCIAGIGWVGGTKAAVGFTGFGPFHTQASDTHAHEVGHNHGLRHAPGCGATGIDPSFPYTTGKIGDGTHPNIGLDIVSPNLKPYTTYYDMMSYCDPEWISDYVYEALLSVHAAPAILQPDRSLNSTSLLVSGTIDAEGNVSLEPAFTLELPSRLPLPGSHTLELIDKRGALLASYPFEPAVLHADRTGAPPTDEIRLIHLAVPYVDGVAELRVTEAGELRGTLRAGGALPHEIAGGLGVSDGRLYLPDALLHGSRGLMVRVSIDAGLSWQTVALGGPGLPAIDLAAFSGRSVLIQIHSSDGVQSVPILTGPLRIP